MKVKVVYLGVARHKAGLNEEDFELNEGSSLKELLAKIAEAHASLKELIGGLGESPADPTLIATLNGSAVNLANSSGFALKNGDVLTLMTVIGGG